MEEDEILKKMNERDRKTRDSISLGLIQKLVSELSTASIPLLRSLISLREALDDEEMFNKFFIGVLHSTLCTFITDFNKRYESVDKLKQGIQELEKKINIFKE